MIRKWSPSQICDFTISMLVYFLESYQNSKNTYLTYVLSSFVWVFPLSGLRGDRKVDLSRANRTKLKPRPIWSKTSINLHLSTPEHVITNQNQREPMWKIMNLNWSESASVLRFFQGGGARQVGRGNHSSSVSGWPKLPSPAPGQRTYWIQSHCYILELSGQLAGGRLNIWVASAD